MVCRNTVDSACLAILLLAAAFPIAAQISASPPRLLNPDATTDSDLDYHPQVATDSAGNWVAVWQNYVTSPRTQTFVYVSRSTDNLATWTDPVQLDTGSDPHVTTDGAGNWVAVWTSSYNDEAISVALSADKGATWTAPRFLNNDAMTDSVDDFRPQVTTDGAGHWPAVWAILSSRGGTLFARSTDNGATWTDSVPLNPAPVAD